MLTAVTDNGEKHAAFAISNDRGYDTDWFCPLCSEEMYYQKRGKDGTVAHFNHNTAATHPRLSEGPLHSKAKQLLSKRLQNGNNTAHVELEKPVGNQSPINPDRIADIYIELADGTSIAVEIQCSSQSEQAFKRRTDDYNDHGLHVLWLLSRSTYLPEKTSRDGNIDGVAYKRSVKWLQRHYYGRIYVFSERTLESESGPAIRPTRVESATRIREWYDEYGYHEQRYTYRTLGEPSYGKLPNYGLLTVHSNSRKIARFYDQCWWDGDAQ